MTQKRLKNVFESLPSVRHSSVRPPSIRPSVSAFYPNPEKMLYARKNFRREKKFQRREKMLDARKNVRREKKFQTREKMLDAREKISDARKNVRREKKFQTREKISDARKNFRREKKVEKYEIQAQYFNGTNTAPYYRNVLPKH
jgi:hypothetical protein